MGKRPVATAADVARQVERTRNEVFANNLGRLMRERGLTMRDLASKIGISHQAVSAWLSAENGPGNRRWAKLANVLGVDVDQLVSPRLVEEGSAASGHSLDDMLPIRLIDAKVLIDARVPSTGMGDDPPMSNASTAGGVLWPLPRIAIDGMVSGQSNIVVTRVGDNALAPVLRMGDFVFADISNPTVVTTRGVYLIVIAGVPTWRRCYPLVGERVLVADSVVRQEVPVSELKVFGRAIRWLSGP